ncbi:hypothetical protein ABE073_04115 [Lederbergia citrisecunda]|uniref:hypothetical protein n=1 Tax=Lederbergia citrisecunda TaxID=2833583 RepID=UPI003D2B8330
MENTIVNEFTFNEVEYFTNLLDSEENITSEQKEDILTTMNLKDVYKIIYKRDNEGNLYISSFINDIQANWNDMPLWFRPYVWEFERDNRVFQ